MSKCTECGEQAPTYWAYNFKGKCLPCIDKWLFSLPDPGPNPLVVMVPKEENDV